MIFKSIHVHNGYILEWMILITLDLNFCYSISYSLQCVFIIPKGTESSCETTGTVVNWGALGTKVIHMVKMRH